MIGTEFPNMRMAHIKGNNAWIDSIIPKSIGYASGRLHVALMYLALIWVLSIPAFLLLIFIFSQIITARSVLIQNGSSLSLTIAAAGLFLTLISIATSIFVVLVPLPFCLKKVAPEPALPAGGEPLSQLGDAKIRP
jgi:hypothetical protein